MKYASVCSGVEAASLAWMPLGWEAAWFSEIEPFPCAVLKERFPGVPNLGDMTKIKVENLENGDQKFTSGDGTVVLVPGGVDLLVGGTPCQSFSVAGKREGLDGASGLARTFIELLGVMQPRWFVWENVPGCLSSRNKQTGIYDFNVLLAAFAEIGYSCGWKIYDAQYCRVDGYPRAVPQRRRRVFVVGHLGAEWQYPAEVLFEPHSLSGNNPPRRVKGQGTSSDAQRYFGMASRPWNNSGVNPALNQCSAATFWNGNQYAESLTCTSDRQLRPDKARMQCVAESTTAFNGGGSENLAISIGNGQVKGLVCKPELARTRHCMHDQQAVMQTATTLTTKGRDSSATGPKAATRATIRRLLPIECERLMGFPDNWTRIPWRGKPAEDCPDSPRYKACGNSMCVNVMRWLGLRIELVELFRSDLNEETK